MKGNGAKILSSLILLGLILSLATPAFAEGGPEPGGLHGKVLEIQGATLVVQTREGEARVQTDANTTFKIPGTQDPSIDDINEGDLIGARGEWTGDKVLHAKLVVVLPHRARPQGIRGIVTAKEGTTLAVQTPDRNVTVLTNDETKFRIPGVENPTVDDIQVDDRILAAGLFNDEGQLLAKAVAALPHDIPRPTVIGQVADIQGATFLLNTRDGQVRVVTNAQTKFKIPGVEDPGLEDIEVGNLVAVWGDEHGEGAITANLVAVVRHRERDRGTAVRGTVAEIRDSSLVLENGDVILTNEDTRYFIPGDPDPEFSDIKLGDRIGAAGMMQEDESLLAKAVAVMRSPRDHDRDRHPEREPLRPSDREERPDRDRSTDLYLNL